MKTERKVARRIAEAGHVLVVCHVSPDGDAIGSMLALGLALRQHNQRATLVCADPVPDQQRHLPDWQSIVTLRREAADGTSLQARPLPLDPECPYDLVISLDCSDIARLGQAYDTEALARVPIINIDHHATNVNFGVVNWVEPGAAATAQLLTRLVPALGIPITADVATCLLNGILTDTLGFRTPNTTTEVMAAAIQLMDAGASLSGLTDHIFNRRPLDTIRIWAMALQHLHLEGRILWGEITLAMRQQVGYREDGDAGLVNFLNTASEADMAVVFDELADGQINVSMRATPSYDISQVALSLGGGGHAQAAGCTLGGPLAAARHQVLSMLQEAWQAQTRGR